VPVHAVGKVDQLFAGVGVDRSHPGPTNPIAIESTDRLLDELEAGLVFVNLVETDQVYGHRKDVPGFERALRQIDLAVGSWLERLREDDLLVLTADHGCDPTTPGTDHTREHAPLLAVFPGHDGRRHDGPLADVGASVLDWLAGRDADLPGTSFLA
jgi:phosphopentomutase